MICRPQPYLAGLASPRPIGVRAWIEWRLVDRFGKSSAAGHQHNLILNKGLDWFLANLWAEKALYYLAVGTGSAAPANTDTGLGAEVARTIATSLTSTRISNGVYQIERNFTFDYSVANYNNTEFGASWSASNVDGTLTRELFRDGANNPIVITKTSNEQLIIKYILQITMSPVVQTNEADIIFKNNSGVQVDSRLTAEIWNESSFGPNPNGKGDYSWIADNEYAATTPVRGMQYHSASMVMAYTGDVTGSGIQDADSNLGAPLQAYVNGNYYRDVIATMNPGAGDVVVYGYSFRMRSGDFTTPAANKGTYLLRFRNADGTDNPFTKLADYKLKLGIRFSLARG